MLIFYDRIKKISKQITNTRQEVLYNMRFLPAAVLILFYTYVGEATHNLRSNSKMKGQDSFLSKRVLARGGKKTTTSTTAPSDPTGPTDPPESLPYPTCTKSSGEVLRLMTMEEVG